MDNPALGRAILFHPACFLSGKLFDKIFDKAFGGPALYVAAKSQKGTN